MPIRRPMLALWRVAPVVVLLLAARCTSTEAPRQVVAAPVVAVQASAPACPTPASGAVTLPQLQGAWRVRSSTGSPEHGHVFLAQVDRVVTIEGEHLRLTGDAFDAEGRPITYPITKAIHLTPCTDPQAITLEQTADAKGWSRAGIVALEGRVLTLSVNFPQERPPSDLRAVDDGREVVVLERM